jgi:hypothetical protein
LVQVSFLFSIFTNQSVNESTAAVLRPTGGAGLCGAHLSAQITWYVQISCLFSIFNQSINQQQRLSDLQEVLGFVEPTFQRSLLGTVFSVLFSVFTNQSINQSINSGSPTYRRCWALLSPPSSAAYLVWYRFLFNSGLWIRIDSAAGASL